MDLCGHSPQEAGLHVLSAPRLAGQQAVPAVADRGLEPGPVLGSVRCGWSFARRDSNDSKEYWGEKDTCGIPISGCRTRARSMALLPSSSVSGIASKAAF